jgi:23S rRNA pseudouridine2604 synthase
MNKNSNNENNDSNNTASIRLNKYLKDQGICSRRKADEFIAKGYVVVNGNIITELGYKVNPTQDKITVTQQLEQEVAAFIYIVLNKPKGYVCSKSEKDGKSIYRLLPDNMQNLSYAGRLDKDSHGLVILSNDGKFSYNVFGAEFNTEKEYIVRVDKPLTPDYIKQQANGSLIIDGKKIRTARVKQIGEYVYKITLTEGINRQIRKMAQALDYKVLDLKRIRVASVIDTDIPLAKWRYLTDREINSISN